MVFLIQLRHLLWKNFILRRRQKVRLVIEILWPLLLFVILMWVRTRGLKTYVQECHFVENALPTAGWLAAIRSYVCNLQNTCQDKASKEDFVNSFNTSLFTNLVLEVEELLKNNTDSGTLEEFESLMKDVAKLRLTRLKLVAQPSPAAVVNKPLNKILPEADGIGQILQNLNSSVNQSNVLEVLSSHMNLERLKTLSSSTFLLNPASILCDDVLYHRLFIMSDTKDLEKIRQQICALPDEEQQRTVLDLLKNINVSSVSDQISMINKEYARQSLRTDSTEEIQKTVSSIFIKLMKLQPFLQRFGILQKKFGAELKAFDSYNNSEKNVLRLMCGKNTKSLIEQRSGEIPVYIEDFRRELLSSIQEKIPFNYDNTTSEVCNVIMANLENSKKFRLFWNQIKPFIRGKILYYPDIQPITEIMNKVNDAFHFFSDLRVFLFEWENNFAVTLKQTLRTLAALSGELPDLGLMMENVLKNENMSLLLQNLFFREILPIENKDIVQSIMQLSLLGANDSLYNLIDYIEISQGWAFILRKFLECIELNRLEPFGSVPSMMDRALQLINESKLWAAIEFIEPVFEDDDGVRHLKPHVVYKIRMDTSKVDNTNQIKDRIPRPGARSRPPLDLKYMQNGFIHLQDLLERSIIEFHTKKENLSVGMWMQQFPYPCYIKDRFIVAVSRSFPLFMTLAWVYTAAMLIRNIVYEKEQRLKEMMRMMGLGNGVHWTSWFISSFIVLFIVAFLLAIILKYGKVLEFSDPVIIFLFLLCYAVSTITFSFLISTWFSRANIAAAAGAIIFFVAYLPYPLLVRWNEFLTRPQKISAAFLSNVAFGFGCAYLAQFEEMGFGVQWDNVVTPDDYLNINFTLGDAMGLLLMDSIIYMLLTMYIEAVWPGEYGIPKPWYFFVTKTYWFGSKHKKPTQIRSPEQIREAAGSTNVDLDFEPEPTHLRLGVAIKNMSKIYGNGKVAVNNLTLNFYEDQITSFLGHNGAGKTTTISILTGMFPPTYGTAYIYNKDIRTDIKEIRKNLGICPQHNVLFNFLTVEEHLQFYAGLKTATYSSRKEEINQMIIDLGLLHKRHALAKTLSGGMQRKLSISMAFIGGSRTVILDEPTAGIDPYSRRSIWELLIKYKQKKTIILTTHYMDEADLLGDRIAIIANGKLCCCGSSLFLKSRFGEGYYLTLVKEGDTVVRDLYDPDKSEEDEGLFLENENMEEREMLNVDEKSDRSNDDSAIDSDKSNTKEDSPVTKLIKQHVSDAKLIEDIGLEMTYILPTRNLQSNAVENLLKHLDREMKTLNLSSYGISDANLEEVFLKVANTGMDEIDRGRRLKPWQKFRRCVDCRKTSVISTQSLETNFRELITEISSKTNKGPLLLFGQFYALFTKRFLTRIRNIKGLFSEIVLPAVFVCLALLFTLIIPIMGPRPALELTPWLFEAPNYVFYSTFNPEKFHSKLYESKLVIKPYLGTRCVANALESAECSVIPDPLIYLYSNTTLSSKNLEPCDCSVGTPVCTAAQLGPEPPKAKISTGDYLVNMTEHNISDWLVKTERKFLNHRFGGFTFGAKNPLATLNLSLILEWMERVSEAGEIDSLTVIRNKLLFKQFGDSMMAKETVENIKVWFNNQGWTSSVAYLNAINNVLLRSHLPEDRDPSLYGITAINHPVSMTSDELVEEIIRRSTVALLQAICVIFAMSFVPASFVLYLIDERISKFKHLQFVSGVKRSLYWIINFFCDILNYTVTVILCILIFLAFRDDAYVSEQNFFPLCCLLMLYGWACIPLMYPVSFIISIPSAAFIILGCANLFVGVVTTVTTFTLEIMNDEELEEIAEVLRKVFLIFPHYCLGRGLIDMSMNQMAVETLGKLGYGLGKNPFEWDFLGQKLLSMAVQGFIWFAITLLMEYNIFLKFRCWQPSTENINVQDEDDDVAKERQRINSSIGSNAVIRVENLTKIYRTRKFHFGKIRPKSQIIAVKSLCFEVQAGECFGLLGVNGAGKTSTFQMLTGDTSVTSGSATLCGFSILTEMNKVQRNVGYCPQFDALNNLLTVREHLKFFALLRGIPFHYTKKTVYNSIRRLGLIQYRDKLARMLSGGNKRKLSTAIALIGEPQIIFLDEPTTGMDPKSKRFLWDCILTFTKEGKSIVLTSHSMEECEALCSRLAIMVNGQFRCLGSIQHLKNKFGSGYLITARINTELSSVSQFIDSFATEFPNAELTEVHHNQVQFQLPLENLKLYRLFNKMEMCRSRAEIEDYSISQTTLDQVFVNFAKHQTEYVQESENIPAQRFIQVPKGASNDNSRNSNGTVLRDEMRSKSKNQLHGVGEGHTIDSSKTSRKWIRAAENTIVESTDL